MTLKHSHLRELDFLRGIAILLVLCRHIQFNTYTTNMGWIGVDLFFVLSGFLVSGILFREIIQTGSVDPIRFLIRRAFKIYPLYYPFLALYTWLLIRDGHFSRSGVFSEVFFIQNYVTGLGWSFPPGWSLAVEEHFYFAIAVLIGIIQRNAAVSWLNQNKKDFRFLYALLIGMAGCLVIRLIMNSIQVSPDNFVLTHLRLDSLLAGVAIAFLYYFRMDQLSIIFVKTRHYLLPAGAVFLSFAPFIENPASSPFALTFGLTFTYLAFGMWLLYFLMTSDINKRLNRYLSSPVTTAIARIGSWSYSIYLVHWLIINRVSLPGVHPRILMTLHFALSIAAGAVLTATVESFFLRLRDRQFPFKRTVSTQILCKASRCD